MRRSLSLARICICLAGLVACRRTSQPPPPLAAQVSGTVAIQGLIAPVRIVRDRWGVPHVYASNRDDLFIAQGFVHAEDRLFQMDLWRRAVQGRLAEVLGANFIERDAMTRRFQYRGDIETEWAAYGPETKTIAAAFVRGVNAWVARALERPPEEFVRAGWKPSFWAPPDVLNRTDAFLESGDALAEVTRAHLHEVVADAIRRVGTPPFFSTLSLSASAEQTASSAAGGAAARRNGELTFSQRHRVLSHPSQRYVIHLKAPGWNVAGFASPWLPGVVIGHNERIAWAMLPLTVDTQDVYAEPLTTATPAGTDAILVKGRRAPFVYDTDVTPHGVVVAVDRTHGIGYSVRWSGTEAGGAAELAAATVDRAHTWSELRGALSFWKMPPRRIVYADADGHIGFQDAGLIPIRRRNEWSGWADVQKLPHAFDPARGEIAESGADTDLPRIGSDAVFVHVLATTAAARQRFNIGPVARPSADDSPVRAVFDPKNWDRSRVINAPGQSGSPDSPHFADLVRLWSAGEEFPLVFSDSAVEANAASTLMLIPK
jgi:penicillin G amidase